MIQGYGRAKCLRRAIAIIQLLAFREFGYTRGEIAQELGLSPRQVSRDLKALIECGVPIYWVTIHHMRIEKDWARKFLGER